MWMQPRKLFHRDDATLTPHTYMPRWRERRKGGNVHLGPLLPVGTNLDLSAPVRSK
jgi:hypothetical protein